jgi:branched-chain amino acid transport system substrate-binding protein
MKKLTTKIAFIVLQTTIIAAVTPPQTQPPQQPLIITPTKPMQQEAAQQATPSLVIPTTTVAGKQEIPICATLPLKGELTVLGSKIFDGMSLFFNKIKKENMGLQFSYRLTVLDDQNDMHRVKNNIKKLKKNQSPLFISLLGTETITTALPSIKQNTICALFPLEGASQFRRDEYKNLIFFRASYKEELEALIDYAKNAEKDRIAIFYEASDWGKSVYQTLKEVLASRKLELFAEATYPQDTLNVLEAAQIFAEKAPNAIVCASQSRPAYNFIQQIVNKGLHKTIILGLSSLISIQQPLKGSRGIKIVTSSVVPDPSKSNLQLVQEYRADLKKYFSNREPTTYSLEGYINAALLTECTKLVTFPLTSEKLVHAIENLKKVRFKGIELNFDPATRTLCHHVWINDGRKREWPLATK